LTRLSGLTRGIQQGNPLSPYNFVACVERLSQLIEVMVQAGQWRPVQVCKNGPRISSLFFADDIVLFVEAIEAQAEMIKGCLDRFCVAFGQKVSASKSRVYFSPNTNEIVYWGWKTPRTWVNISESLPLIVELPSLNINM